MYLADIARRKAPDMEISYEDMDVMLRFYACGMVGVLMSYVGKRQLNEEKLVRQLEKIITGNMFPAQER